MITITLAADAAGSDPQQARSNDVGVTQLESNHRGPPTWSQAEHASTITGPTEVLTPDLAARVE